MPETDYTKLPDDELRDLLVDVDNDAEGVSKWEAKFIDDVAFKRGRPMSERQREAAIRIIEAYL